MSDDPETTPGPVPAQSISVFRAEDFRVGDGAHLGDPVSVLDDLVPGDIYMLSADARPERLTLLALGNGSFRIAPDTGIGTPGATVHLDCALDLMPPGGQTTEALVLVELDARGRIEAVYLLPLAQLTAKIGYTLVGADRGGARRKLAQIACVSFARGTHVTMATGLQVPIEDLRVGDRVLTRSDGAQPITWIGQSTVRASGALAPILIEAGVLNNANDLIVSPDHRLFIYQRRDRLGIGQSEVLVKARHLVNGDTVRVMEGGFVDYFQILFDRHHIIYAEGIAAESTLIDPRTRPVLPPELLARLTGLLPGHDRPEDHGYELQRALLNRPDAIDILRRASLG